MEVEEGNSLSESVFHKCVVCNRMFEDDINILDGYIEELVKKKYSLSTVMKMSYEFRRAQVAATARNRQVCSGRVRDRKELRAHTGGHQQARAFLRRHPVNHPAAYHLQHQGHGHAAGLVHGLADVDGHQAAADRAEYGEAEHQRGDLKVRRCEAPKAFANTILVSVMPFPEVASFLSPLR